MIKRICPSSGWNGTVCGGWVWRYYLDEMGSRIGVFFARRLRRLIHARLVMFTGDYTASYRWANLTRAHFFALYESEAV